MNANSYTRIPLLLLLIQIGLIGIFCMPADDTDTIAWYAILILSKLIGAASFRAFSRLYERWKHTDRWIKAYDQWINRDDQWINRDDH